MFVMVTQRIFTNDYLYSEMRFVFVFMVAEMLQSEESRRLEMAIRCMEALCVNADPFWRDVTDAGHLLLFETDRFTTFINLLVCIDRGVHAYSNL